LPRSALNRTFYTLLQAETVSREILVGVPGLLRMFADIGCGVVGKGFVGCVAEFANLSQDYLLAPFDNVNGVDGVLLGLKTVRAQCRVDVFRGNVPITVY